MINTKAGARHSATDQQAIQAAHDKLVSAGATCGATKAWTPASAIKATPEGHVTGWLVRYGGPDVVGDHFVKGADFGVKNGQQVGLYFHHGMDKTIGADPIGSGTVTQLEAGLWFDGWLSKRAKYLKYILKMAAEGMLGFSSGADPTSVVRVPIAGKAREYALKTWHIIEASLTPIPAAGPSATAAMIKAGGGSLTAAQNAAIEREMAIEDALEARKARILAQLDALERS